MVISYSTDFKPEPHQLIDLFNDAGLRRPTDDFHRIKRMLDNSNLCITAWDGNKLIGVVRGFSDLSYFCYISDIAINREYHDNEIEHDMIEKLLEHVGPECSVLYISPDKTDDILLETGFEKIDYAYLYKRKK